MSQIIYIQQMTGKGKGSLTWCRICCLGSAVSQCIVDRAGVSGDGRLSWPSWLTHCRQFTHKLLPVTVVLMFQRYFWFKKKHAIWTDEHPFPRDVEYLLYDTLEQLRPKTHMPSSWDEASQAADALDKEFASKLGVLLRSLFFYMFSCLAR